MNLLPHHQAWLDSRPDRTVVWLRDRLREGFHIHHIDGNHGNNDPRNLALVEGADHMKFHGHYGLCETMISRRAARSRRRSERANEIVIETRRAALAYRLRQQGYAWSDITNHLWSRGCDSRAMGVAKSYAAKMRMPWPVPQISSPGARLKPICKIEMKDCPSIRLACRVLYPRQGEAVYPWERAA